MIVLAFLLSFNSFCAEECSSWERLIANEGCLMSATDIDFTTSGSIFEKKDWQSFFQAARKDEKIFIFIIRKFSSRRPTQIHICNFRNATEGELAVFVAQQIVKKNWHVYNGDNCEIKRIVKKKVAAKVLLLPDILSDKSLCIALQRYFIEHHKLKFRHKR